MRPVSIRLGGGTLLIGRPGVFTRAMLAASDRQGRDAALRALPTRYGALAQLRRGWSDLVTGQGPDALDGFELAGRLNGLVGTGRLEAVFLRHPRLPIAPAEIEEVQSKIINAGTDNRRLLIGRPGAIPKQVAAPSDPKAVFELLKSLPDDSPTAIQLERQAKRLLGPDKAKLRGGPLRAELARAITTGRLQAAVVQQAPVAARLAAQPDAQKPVIKMSDSEKIVEALERSLPYAVKSGSKQLEETIRTMLEPANLAVMAGIAAAVAAAHAFPLAGAAIDTVLIGMALYNGGEQAVRGLGMFASATMKARSAASETQLNAAAEAYGEALGMMGVKFLSAIFARFMKKGGGKSSKDGKVAVSGGKGAAKPPQPVRKQPAREAKKPPPPPPPEKPKKAAPANPAKQEKLREKYMGRTPGKGSRTGREVIERMRKEGRIIDDPIEGTMFKDSQGAWRPLADGDMSHLKDAVKYWNEEGYKYGPKSEQVRKFMLDPDNYDIDYFGINRSKGAILGQTQNYRPPLGQ